MSLCPNTKGKEKKEITRPKSIQGKLITFTTTQYMNNLKPPSVHANLNAYINKKNNKKMRDKKIKRQQQSKQCM